jgi:hypothetical protein
VKIAIFGARGIPACCDGFDATAKELSKDCKLI